MKGKIISLALLIISAAGCNTTKTPNEIHNNDPDKEMITKHKWILVKLAEQDIPINKAPVYFTLDPEENKVNGFAGCNTFMGGFTLAAGNHIQFSQIASTRVACPDMEIDEREVLNAFESANDYSITGDTLMLKAGRRGTLAIFKKEIPQITGKYWKLIKLDGQAVKMDENQEKEAYFILKNDNNQVTGFAGCNSFSGNYSLAKGTHIHFSQIAATMKACPDVNINESEFLNVLQLADNYTLDGDIFSLNVGKRTALAVFEAVYFE
ncbi:META domain-containing protein [Zunongwangia sp. H14]|uniref:META domain-containing protein n=1 Tax=Zunongwangia sp. H14 TaxID=3240792 RepID=UPI0035645506